MSKFSFGVVLAILLIQACNQSGTVSHNEDFFPEPDSTSVSGVASEVIYALTLPTDIVKLFEETGTGFNPSFLIPLDRIPFYDHEGQMALLMGALGVDLSYCKLFERVLESAECYKHIELLADKLDLPQEIFEKTTADLEQYMNDPDSITHLIDRIYGDMDRHFKAHDQESLASLSLLGGWLEAMYIGVKIYEDKGILEMGDRILQQKFALNNLLGLLFNHQETLLVTRYMHPMSKLKNLYESVEIRYPEEGFEMNQQNQTIHASSSNISYPPESLDSICEMITRVRGEMMQ